MKTNTNRTHTHYTVRKTSRTTARIAIESNAFIDTMRKQEIWRFFLDGYGNAEMHKGAVIGREPDKTCALLIWVSRGDVICLREKLIGMEDHQWRYFRIGNAYDLIPLEIPNQCLAKHEMLYYLENVDLRESYEMAPTDDDLVKFFAQKHPKWLQLIADNQIQHWQTHKPKKFFRFAPVATVEGDISRCVKISPFAALARFQDRLTAYQLACCISRSPKGAVMFALDKIEAEKRKAFLIDHAKDALLHAAEKLSDADLHLCSSMHMFTAFQIRDRMPPHRRAIVLANSYMIAFFASRGLPMDPLHEEIINSICEHPAQWRASDPAGFSSIFKGLSERIDMTFDSGMIATLFKKTAPADQQALAEFISSHI